MKGEKGIPGAQVGDSLSEDLTEDSFSKQSSISWHEACFFFLNLICLFIALF